ncbi:MAG: hypothetical protein ACR2GY_03995 [Phycisphaerales bacterium]
MHRTLNDVRREGLEALLERLGKADMIRFLQQFENGSGDYATERHAWADELTLDDLRDRLEKRDNGAAESG